MRTVLVMALCALMSLTAYAQESVTLTYQGSLASAAGNPVTASHPMTFTLYRQVSGGDALWTELHGGVDIVDGVFSVDLGTVTPLLDSLSDEALLYLGVTVGDNDEMTPRIRVGGALKAQWAKVADHARDVRGEDIHPNSVSIGDTPVINDQGQWVGDPTGLVGAQGDRGPEGPAGPQGAAGPAGVQGEAGPAGAKGDAGDRGPEGPRGIQGEQGPVGPAVDLSADSDLDGIVDWIELAMGTNPLDETELPGDANQDGIPDVMVGPAGLQGPAGVQGEAGPAGADGNRGPQGESGPQGASGPAGAQGEAGPAGPAGAPGVAGEQGVQGPAGPAGAPGPIGAPGISVTDAVIDNGDLLLRLSTGETINAGRTRGDTGPGLDLELDSDGDGIVDWLEVTLGTDPNDGASTPTDANEDGVPDELAGGGQNAGDGNNESHSNGGGFLIVAAGMDESCGVRSDGSGLVACVGQSPYNLDSLPSVGTARAITVFNAQNQGTVCVIDENGAIFCGGGVGPSGSPDDSRNLHRPPPGEFLEIQGDRYDACARHTDGTIACWGENRDREPVDTAPLGDRQFTNMALNSGVVCAIGTNGGVECQCILGGRCEADNPLVDDVPDGSFREVAPQSSNFCGIRVDGSIVCWGYQADRYTPPATPLVQLASTSYAGGHLCGLKQDGTVICWGNNSDGQSWPVPSGTYTDISTGSVHTCAIRTDGATVCWGSSDNLRTGCSSLNGIPLGEGYYCVL